MSPSTLPRWSLPFPSFVPRLRSKLAPFSGTRPSCCSCSWIRNFVAVALIAEAASCRGDKHHRQRPKADQNRYITAVVVHDGNGKRLIQDRQKRVKRGMHQDGHEQPAPSCC